MKFEVYAAVWLRHSLLWDVTQHILTYLPTFSDTHSGSSVHEEWLTLEYWIGRLSLNIGKGLPT